MKKNILFVMILFCMSFMACNKNNDTSISSGTYVMEIENSQEIISPFISIDTEQNEFQFSYDVLSSYLPIGTYEINDNILTATTNDNKYHYVFKIIDENTLSFVEESSSEITVFDKKFSVVPQYGAIFKIIEETEEIE